MLVSYSSTAPPAPAAASSRVRRRRPAERKSWESDDHGSHGWANLSHGNSCCEESNRRGGTTPPAWLPRVSKHSITYMCRWYIWIHILLHIHHRVSVTMTLLASASWGISIFRDPFEIHRVTPVRLILIDFYAWASWKMNHTLQKRRSHDSGICFVVGRRRFLIICIKDCL